MAGSPVVQFAGPSYHLADRKAAVQASINCYPSRLEGNSFMLRSTPGEVTVATLGGPVRGTHVALGRLFIAAGSTLYEMLADETTVVRGTLGAASGFVGMDNNATQLAIVDGANLGILSLDSSAYTGVTTDGWRGSRDVVELDGYFVFVAPGSEQFYLSAIDDGTKLDALDFSSADSAPDNTLAHLVSHRQLWFFGPYDGEIWVDSGDVAFPFVRYQGYTLDVGIVGPLACINAADTIFWVGQTQRGAGIVYMAQGNQPQRVSTQAVEEALRSSSDLSQATMWRYQIEGHEFIGINAPGLETTWVYDAATQLWHERAEWADGWQPLRSRLAVSFNGKHYAGDASGAFVRLDPAVNTLSGRVLKRERTWPHLKQPSMEPVTYRGVELAMTSGEGGSVTLEVSNDGGATFLAPLLRSLGVTGRRMQRIRWLALGAAFNRVFRVSCSDPVSFSVHGATVDTK